MPRIARLSCPGSRSRVQDSRPSERGTLTSMAVQIPLTHGRVALVDEGDLPIVSGIRWTAQVRKSPGNELWYAVSERKRGQAILMHRLILGLKARSEQCDHISGDGLDNRRSNLRLASNSQNQANRRKNACLRGRPTSSKYKGIYWDKTRHRWRAVLRHNGKLYRIGRFRNERDAAAAYDLLARKLFGDFARLNLSS